MSGVLNARFILVKSSTNKLNNDILNKHIKEMVNCTLNRPAAKDVKCISTPVNIVSVKSGFQYSIEITLGRTVSRSESMAEKCMEGAKKLLMKAAEVRGWSCRDAQDVEQAISVAGDRAPFAAKMLDNETLQNSFNGIFSRESHIRVIHDAVVNAVETNFNERDHVLLYGPPAVCKSMLFKRFKKFYEDGGDVERVALINSVTLSKAGLESWILERAKDKILPEILCFDEIEKFNMDNLQCLLQLMDETGVISRTNAKIGRQVAEAKVLIWATCNDEKKLREFNSGSLWSRFTKRLGCGRPSRDEMHRILTQQIKERIDNGESAKLEWVDAAINYAFDNMKTNDPREVKGLLSGRDRLLDGSYFKDLEKINENFIRSVTNVENK